MLITERQDITNDVQTLQTNMPNAVCKRNITADNYKHKIRQCSPNRHIDICTTKEIDIISSLLDKLY